MKKIVIGIDISKEKLDATAIDVRNGRPGVVRLDYRVFDNRAMGFRRMLVWARRLVKGVGLDDVLFCCETTGGYDRALCDYIYAKGFDIWRESALQIQRSCGVRRGKDDRADSLMIAEYAMRHLDKAVCYVSPDATIQELKALLLYRHRLVRERASKKVRAAQLRATAARSKSMAFIMRDAARMVRELDKSIRECERRILQIVQGDEGLKRNYGHVTSIKSVGIVNATTLIVYSNNFRNITTANKMATYYGCASFRLRSGTSIDRRAEVGQFSNSMLRAYITQAAEHAVQQGGIYHDYFLRKQEEGKHYGIILNNVKNKIIHLAYSLVQNDMDYEENHETLRSKRKGEARA